MTHDNIPPSFDLPQSQSNVITAPTLASADIITPSSAINFITGTAQLKTITPPFDGNHELVLIFTDNSPGTFLTTGNIGLAITPAQNASVSLFYEARTKKYYPARSSGGNAGNPSAPINSVQFNNAGVFGGDADLLWNKTDNLLEFTYASGLSFASGVGAPITMVGGDDGGSKLTIDDVIDSYVRIFLPSFTDLNIPQGLTITPDNYTNNLFFDAGGKIRQERVVSTLAAMTSTVGRELFSNYEAIGGSATTSFFTGDWNEINIGIGGVATLGIITNRVDNTFIDGSGSVNNTFATYHSVLEANIGTGFTQSAGPTGQFFLSDWQVYGPIGVQPKILQGGMIVMENFFNGAPSGAPSNGLLLITKKGIGDGNATHLAADTFPMGSAIQIHGYSTASAVDGIGWTTGIEIGGSGSPWGESKSIIGTGIHIRDYTTDGIVIDNPSGSPTASIRADGLIQGGTIQATTAFKSTDGSAGATTTITTASLVGKTITVKNGLITSFA